MHWCIAMQRCIAYFYKFYRYSETHGAKGGSVSLYLREGFADLDINQNVHYSPMSPRTLVTPGIS